MIDFEDSTHSRYVEPFTPWSTARNPAPVGLVGDGPVPKLAAAVTHVDGAAIVSLTGEVDIATVPSLERRVGELLALPVDSVLLDLEGVTFMDSGGLHALQRLRSFAEDHRVILDLCCVPFQIRRLLEITGMTDASSPQHLADLRGGATATADGFD